MNTLEQPLRNGHENLIVDEPRISRTASRTPRRAPTRVVRERHGRFGALPFVMSLSAIAVLFYSLRSVFGDLPLPRQEFEGLGIVVCALAYIGIFLWRLTRGLEREAQSAFKKSGMEFRLQAADAENRVNAELQTAAILLQPIFQTSFQQVEASEKPSEIPSAVVRRMQTGE